MAVTLLGMVILTRAVQPTNELRPISVTEFGIITSLMSVRFTYAFSSIIVVPGGIVNVPVAIVGVGGEQHQNAKTFSSSLKCAGGGDQEVQPVKA